jgi:hypothetical protein
MKRILLVFCLMFFSGITHSQSPFAIPYQAVARDVNGVLLQNQPVSVLISIHDFSAFGPVLYTEVHAVTTNNLGLFNINIGMATTSSGIFSAINWSAGAKFLEVGLDPNGGMSFTPMGVTQFMSVPYALNAGTADAYTGSIGGEISGTLSTLQINNNVVNGSKIAMGADAPGDILYYNGIDYVRLPAGNSNQVLRGGVAPFWSSLSGLLANHGFVSATCTAPTTSIAFINTPAQLVISGSSQKTHVTATVSLGASAVAASGLNLYVGYKNLTTGGAVTSVGGGTFGLTCPVNTRSHFTLSAIITGLSAGTYQFGMVGSSSSPANWNNNEWGYVTVMVFE